MLSCLSSREVYAHWKTKYILYFISWFMWQPHTRSGSWKHLALENKGTGNSVSKLMGTSNSACCSKIMGVFSFDI